VIRLRGMLLLLLVALTLPATARDYNTMYSAQQLQRANAVYSPNILAVLHEDIAPYLLPAEKQTLEAVTLLQPWDRTVDPFEFAARADTREILIPTFSVKFFDELAIATAWFERFDCRKETIGDYVAALDFSTLQLPPILAALSLPEDAYKLDSFVDDVSQKALKSAVAFLLMHELAHVHLNHASYDRISANTAQQQEAQADAFAMRIMRRMRLPPLGMAVWFNAISLRDPLLPGSNRQTHPLTSSRLQAIADELRRQPYDFISSENRGKISEAQIVATAGDFETIATLMDTPDMRTYLRQRGSQVTLEQLATACN
jgi:Peptidase U49